MADETKDVSNPYPISFVFWYYYNGAINKSFLNKSAEMQWDLLKDCPLIIHIMAQTTKTTL